MASDSNKRGGVGFFGLLALLFIGLKLGGAIHWSWWWVMAPLWGPPVLFVTFVLIVGVVVFMLSLLGLETTVKNVR